MNESWIKETMELINDLEKRRNEIEGDLSSLMNEKDELEQQIIAAEYLIRLYRNKHKELAIPLDDVRPGYFGSKTYPEILIDIATKSNNFLKVADAVEIMLCANVGKDKRSIQANTYSALGRMKQHFSKIRNGEYRYTNGIQKTPMQRGTKFVRTKSGVQQAVKELKDRNPQMTNKEVLNHLLRTGFDFKGKKPSSAVNIVWAKLGYSKEGKQQAWPDLILRNRNGQVMVAEAKVAP